MLTQHLNDVTLNDATIALNDATIVRAPGRAVSQIRYVSASALRFMRLGSLTLDVPCHFLVPCLSVSVPCLFLERTVSVSVPCLFLSRRAARAHCVTVALLRII